MKSMNNKKRKTISIVLAFAVMLTTMLSNVSVAEAATQNDAVNWAKAQIGKGLDYDGVYGNQCVDLIKYYYNYFGVAGYAKGNASAYISNALPSGWTRVYSGFQPGDVAVWKVNHSCNTCGTNSYGHVGIITSVSGAKFSAVNQNFNSQSHCTHNNFNLSALACAIRPKYSSPAPNVSFAEYSQKGVWDTNAELYVKVMNPSRAHVSAVGCYLYDVNGALVKSYSESCSFNTSYVNYTCNFNNDMKYTLTAGTTYKCVLYAIVGGNQYKDVTRTFTTTGSNDKTKPVISDVSVYDVSETGYKVRCKATDNVGVVRVQFPTWTVYQGQDDIQSEWWQSSKAAGTKDASGYYVYEVKASDHNGELGDYITHIYVYDRAGNHTAYNVSTTTLKKEVVVTPQPTPKATKAPDTGKPDVKQADGNAMASVAEREYGIYKGQAYGSQYGTSPWCCNFVSWCAREAGITSDVIVSTATVQTMYDKLLNDCGASIVSSPQRGDLVFYKYTNYDSERYHHIGIMTSSNETVQGNVNNTWWKGTPEALNNIKQMTYVRPAYNGIYVPSGAAYFSSYKVNRIEETNAEVYIKVENPKRESVTEVGCGIYNEDGNLLKEYSEKCSFTTSYVNYTCNFNSDMGYELSPGTTYQFRLYAVVGGKKLVDSIRSFTTAGDSEEEEDISATAPDDPEVTVKPTTKPTVKPTVRPTVRPTIESDDETDDEMDDEWENDPEVIEVKTPKKVTGLKVRAGRRKIYVSWKFNSSINRTGYQLQYATNKSFSKSKKTVKLGYYTTNKTIKNLKKGKRYYVRVRAVNRVGSNVKYGKWSAVKKIKVKK